MTTMRDGQPTSVPWPNIEPVTYSAFYGQLAKALAGQGDVPVKPEVPRDVIRLIELARMSSKDGRTLEVGEHYENID